MTTTCPNCGSNFIAADHRTYKGIVSEFFESINAVHKAPEVLIDESSMVRCPNCGTEYKSGAVRFFRVLSPKGLKIFLGLFVFGFLCFVIWVLSASFR